MPNLSRYEQNVIAVTLFVGLTGGSFFVYIDFPAIVASLFFAIATATLVYHFLGGIEEANFNLGPVKLGGSIAALIASTFIINTQLSKQQQDPNSNLHLDRQFRIVSSDSTVLGRISLDDPELNDDLSITINDSLTLGQISKTDLRNLRLFDQITFNNYIEVRYDLNLSPFSAEKNFNAFANRYQSKYQNAYADLPFEVIPNFTYDRGMHTVIKPKSNSNSHFEPDTLSISSGWTRIIELDDRSIHLVRLRGSNASDTTNPFYANYQIISVTKGIHQ